MPIGLLLLTHEPLASALLAAATAVHGAPPLKVATFELAHGLDPESLLADASAAMRRAEGGEDGVLILTDLAGAAPARLARKLAQLGTPCRRVSGLSLPMLLRVFNYAEQELDELARTAAAGGRNGVVNDDA
ncbi:PTS sugar transporter subunit IIA [Arenimonas sp.]|uniref:PTS sugar transporter subunit IIA n=1 Tax=Arenimonas sp. TaxID=1872635 RepID=UPI0039E2C055